MPPHEILPYSIDQLLQGTSAARDSNNNRSPGDTHNQSYSDVDDQSDDGKSVSPPSGRKCEKRPHSAVDDDVRLRVNSRERQRMHELNSALDNLRQVMPYPQGRGAKKPSKRTTLEQARDYIVLLSKSLEEMRKLADVLSTKKQASAHISQSTSPMPVGYGPMPSVYNMNTQMSRDLPSTAVMVRHSLFIGTTNLTNCVLFLSFLVWIFSLTALVSGHTD